MTTKPTQEQIDAAIEAFTDDMKQDLSFLGDTCAEHYETILAALEAYKQPHAVDVKWQPIDTAPKDGRNILVINGAKGGYGGSCGDSQKPYHIGVAYYMNSAHFGGPWYATDCCDGVSTYRPTHWMPLPEPPNDFERDIREALKEPSIPFCMSELDEESNDDK